MNRLSRYILREFVSFLWYIVLAFAVIFILVDLVENVDKFIDDGIHYHLIALYYFFYLPYIVVLTLPVSMLLATMFSLGRLVGDNEITAMKSSGVSLYRILMPLFGFSLVMCLFVMLFAELIVPRTNIYREDIKSQGNDFRFTFSQTREMDRNHVYLMNGDGKIVYARSYQTRNKTARGVIIYEPLYIDGDIVGEEKIANGIRQRIDADYMVHSNDIWVLHNVVVRNFDENRPYETIDRMPAPFLTRKPSDFARIELEPEEMNFVQLRDYIGNVREKGGDASEWYVDLYMKIAFPFVSFVIVFFGAPMTAGATQRGKTASFGIALAISFTYYALINASQVLGRNGTFSPVIAAWAPNGFFFIVGACMLLRAKK